MKYERKMSCRHKWAQDFDIDIATAFTCSKCGRLKWKNKKNKTFTYNNDAEPYKRIKVRY